jgi:AraC-like DNA-binding protein
MKTVPRSYRPLNPTTGKRSVISPRFSPKRSVRLDMKPNASRLPVDLLAGLLSSNRASESFTRFRQRAVNHVGVARCLDSLSRNPQLKLSQLTAASGLSRRGLIKAFRTHLDCTPGVVMIVLRLRAALNLLSKSRLPLPTIAVRAGYRNSNSLYVAFRHYLGITPASVRKHSFPWVTVNVNARRPS